jgi:hypothetical protein
MRAIIIFLAGAGLCGCALAWGKSYKVEFASPTSITINTDPAFTDMGTVQNIAQKHCSQYGKDAVPQGAQDTGWGARELSFVCTRRD